MNSKITVCSALLALCLFSGCGEKLYTVTGTVKYSDGSPVTLGFVNFDSDKFSFTAPISANGQFSSPGKNGTGVPEGTYRVSLSGTTISHDTPDERGQLKQGTPEPTVAEKFCSPATSDLTFEAKSGASKTFDIVVEKPGK